MRPHECPNNFTIDFTLAYSITNGATPNRSFKLARKKGIYFAHIPASNSAVRQQIMSESESDKKRNKLGYQRISVACAHCRRRKIRCIPAENDDQSRCQNCIRLNKECVFYPVDQQQSASDKSAASSARTTTTPSSATTVSQSPQDMVAGRPFEPQMQFGMMPSNTPHGFQGYDTAAMMHPQGAFGYNYRSPEGRHQWASPDLSSQPQANVPGTAHNSADVSWHAYMPMEHAHNPPAPQYFPESRSYSYPGIDEARQWQMLQQQGRAMSYAGLDSDSAQLPNTSLPGHTQYFGPPITGVQSAPAIVSAPFRYDQQPVFAHPQVSQSPTDQSQGGWYHEYDEHGQQYVPGSSRA